jgi:hypothetical protein
MALYELWKCDRSSHPDEQERASKRKLRINGIEGDETCTRRSRVRSTAPFSPVMRSLERSTLAREESRRPVVSSQTG